MVQYPTTPVVDGITNQSLNIPKCIEMNDSTYYCFDYMGRLVNVQSNVPEPIAYNINKTYVNPNKVIAQIDAITPIEPNLELAAGILIVYNNPYLQSNNGYFVNESVLWQGWPSLSIYSASVTPGTGGAYGSAVTLFSNVNQNLRQMIVPLFLSITWGGTFASGETVSVEVNFTIAYNTNSPTTLGTATLTASATSPGTQNFGCAQIYAVIAPYLNSNYNYNPNTKASYSQYISQITATAASNASSTSVTVTVTVVGFHT